MTKLSLQRGYVQLVIVVILGLMVGGAFFYQQSVKIDNIGDNESETQLTGTNDVPLPGGIGYDADPQSGRYELYENPEYGFQARHSAGFKVSDADVTGGRAVGMTVDGTHVEVLIQSQEYDNSALVQAQCNDAWASYVSMPITINGINFLKTDISSQFGGTMSAAIAQSYCTMHNGVRYRIIPRISYNRYPCQNERDGVPVPNCIPNFPDRDQTLEKFDDVVTHMQFSFTPGILPGGVVYDFKGDALTNATVRVISPNGGESFVRNENITVTWEQSLNSDEVTLCLLSKTAGCTYTETLEGKAGMNSRVIPPNAQELVCATGKPNSSCYLDSGYKVKIFMSGGGLAEELAADESDDYFKITNYFAN